MKIGPAAMRGSLQVYRTDPLHVAEDQDEQDPEENGDDSCSNEDHNLHVGLIAGTFTHTHRVVILNVGRSHLL